MISIMSLRKDSRIIDRILIVILTLKLREHQKVVHRPLAWIKKIMKQEPWETLSGKGDRVLQMVEFHMPNLKGYLRWQLALKGNCILLRPDAFPIWTFE
mmetsp:Transcript_30093/g.49002  ORF Transcript_30093/g.49002 Transcript_30093/m.49002 type:complete len:99 (-) Transcript_30093:916-1212(-)